MCLIPGKERKDGTQHKLFRGIFGVKNGVPNGPFSARKCLVYWSFSSPLFFSQTSIFLSTPRGSGYPGKFPGHPRFLPSKPKEDKLSREGKKLFDPHPFAWKTPHPTRRSRDQKVNHCALSPCLICGLFLVPDFQLLLPNLSGCGSASNSLIAILFAML